MKRHHWFLLAVLGSAGPAAAQSTIATTERHAYTANAGWIDFRPSMADGVRVTETCLAGKAYAANFGWIDFGNGAPANGHTYQNNSATDYGVNLSPEGHLTGQAWSANTGWITFEQLHGKPRLSYLSGRLSGHAWSGNLGWIVLDTEYSDLINTQIRYPDTDGDGIGDAWEQLHFGNLTTAGPATDFDHDGHPDPAEHAAGTDPQNPASCLRITAHSYAASQTSATLTFTTQPNRLYTIEHSTDLLTWAYPDPGDFLFAPTPAAATTSKTFPAPGGPRRYFRVTAVLPQDN